MKKMFLLVLIIFSIMLTGVNNTPVFAESSSSNTTTEIISFVENQNQYNFGNLNSFAVLENYIYLANGNLEVFNKSTKIPTTLNYETVTDLKQTENYILFKSNNILKVLKNNVEVTITGLNNIECDTFNAYETQTSLFIAYTTTNKLNIVEIQANAIVDFHDYDIPSTSTITTLCLNDSFTYAILDTNSNQTFIKYSNNTNSITTPTFDCLNCADLELLKIDDTQYFVLTYGYNLNGQNTDLAILKESYSNLEKVASTQVKGITGTSVAKGELSSIVDIKTYNEKIYIADYINKSIQCYDLVDNDNTASGQLSKKLSPSHIELTNASIEEGYFYNATDITIVNDNTFLVADSKNNRLQYINNNNIEITTKYKETDLIKPTLYTTNDNINFAYFYDKYLVRYNSLTGTINRLDIGYDISDIKLDSNNNLYYIDYSRNELKMIEHNKNSINIIEDNIDVDNLSTLTILNNKYIAVHHNKSIYLVDIENSETSQELLLTEQIKAISSDYYGNIYAITASGIQKINFSNNTLTIDTLLSYNTTGLTIIEINKVNGNIYCYNNNNNNIVKIQKAGFVNNLDNYNHIVNTNEITPLNTILSSGNIVSTCYIYEYPHNTNPTSLLAKDTNIYILSDVENSYYVMYNKDNIINYGYINKDFISITTYTVNQPQIVVGINKNIKLYTLPTILSDTNNHDYIYKESQIGETFFVVNFEIISLDNSEYYAVKNGDNILYVNASDVTLQDTEEIRSLPNLNAQIIVADNNRVMLLGAPTDKSILLAELTNNQKIYVEKFDTNNKYTYVTVITEDKQQLSGYVETKYIKLIEDNPNIASAYILLAISILIATASVIIYVKQKSSN